MKTLPLNNETYKNQVKKFVHWLTIQPYNYAERTIRQYDNQIREFFYYLENYTSVKKIKTIQSTHISAFQDYLLRRQNLTKGGGLSASHINGIIKTVMQYLKFLNHCYHHIIACDILPVKEKYKVPDVLTEEEVKQLLESITNSNAEGITTRAKIAILYGAGLRKKELEYLKVEDISFEEHHIHVRNGKGGKERIVPVPVRILEYVREYIHEVRDYQQVREEYLFLGKMGRKLAEKYYYKAVKKALDESNIESLAEKKISLHTFRHSIATHLLKKGMPIEDIAWFLGHSTTDSTMIYTHIVPLV